MKFLVAILAVILTVTPVVAQSSGSDAAATGIAGLIGMFGIFGFLLALVYSTLLLFLPFMVWGCLRRLTSIRDEIRGFRKELASATRMSVAPTPPSTGEQHQVRDVSNLRRLVKENEKSI
jgi:hypothetical protein